MNVFESYQTLTDSPSTAPSHWADSCTNDECTLHQLSPYIGKLKSVIAKDLILNLSKPNELVVDMFCGSGTVPLEAARLGRRVFASDKSIYAVTLTKAKLNAPVCIDVAHRCLDRVLRRAELLPIPDLRRIPQWVRSFFHPRTLKEALRVTQVLMLERRHFFLASMLGILHHQRPGFLSYPSSHLVPYLRSEKFPVSDFPELYEYRPVAPRLAAKVERALKRTPNVPLSGFIEGIRRSSANFVNLPDNIDCVITSPPYMNALDYRRDNRLRLWFLGEKFGEKADRTFKAISEFQKLMDKLARQLERKVRKGGHCVFVVGEQTFRGGRRHPSEMLARSFLTHTSTFRLCDVISDTIPDIRRSRKHVEGVKRENVLVFRKY